jgi:hypothetical protein
MDQRTNGVSTHDHDPAREAERLERRADELREHLGTVVGQLDQRRHDVTRKLKPFAFVLGGIAAAGAIALVTWQALRRRRGQPRRARLFEAFQRMREHPELVARETPNLPKKVAAAALTTLASMAAKRAFAAALPERGDRR